MLLHQAQLPAGHLWWELVWQAATWLVGVSLHASMRRQSAWRLLGRSQPGFSCHGSSGNEHMLTKLKWCLLGASGNECICGCAQQPQDTQMGKPTCHSRRGKGGCAWCRCCCRHRGGWWQSGRAWCSSCCWHRGSCSRRTMCEVQQGRAQVQAGGNTCAGTARTGR